MGAIIDFFKGLADFFVSVVNFVISFFEDLAYIVKLLGDFVLKIPSFFGWLPSSVLAILLTTFGVVVVYKIMGRD